MSVFIEKDYHLLDDGFINERYRGIDNFDKFILNAWEWNSDQSIYVDDNIQCNF